MQLKISTDYAIRMTLYLAMLGAAATAVDISKAMGIPRSYIASVAKPLCDVGILCATRGVNGGFALGMPAEAITLKMIVESTEGTTRINRCLEEDHYCSRNGAETCPVRRFYSWVQEGVDEAFGRMTIAMLLQDPPPEHPVHRTVERWYAEHHEQNRNLDR